MIKTFALVASAAFGIFAASSAQAADFVVVDSFNGSNPNGPFTYTYTNAGTTALLGTESTSGSLVVLSNGASEIPNQAFIVKNTGDTFTSGTVIYRNDYLNLDPQGNTSVDVVFTAPVSGVYNLSGSFITDDTGTNFHDVSVTAGGVTFKYDDLTGPGQSDPFSGTFALDKGQTIDFAVINRGSPYNLGTGLQATISTDAVIPGAVPEPATWALMVLGFGMVGFGLRYRRSPAKVSFA
jgi:hypothetical protein